MPYARHAAPIRSWSFATRLALAAALAPAAGGAPAGVPAALAAGERETGPGIVSQLGPFRRLEANEGCSIPADSGPMRCRGDVLVEFGESTLQADEIAYDADSGTLTLDGNVVLLFPTGMLAGDHMEYDVETETGVIEDATAYLEEEGTIVRAERIERIGPRRLRVEHGVFTSCTQPVPSWSFRVRRGTFDIGRYAYLRDVSFRTGRVPVFYSPYLVWPIKSERAAGLLFPEIESSDRLGQSVRLPIYWPFADNAEVTVYVEGHTKVGPAISADLRWLPTWNGSATGAAFFIHDELRRKDRYQIDWSQKQRLGERFRLRSRLELVSDFDYFTDYETDLRRAARPLTTSRVDLTRDWSWYSLSVRAERREQFFVGGTRLRSLLTGKRLNTLLPEVELRSRSRKLGNSRIHLGFTTSLTRFERKIRGLPDAFVGLGVEDEGDLVTTTDNGYWRLDLAPQWQLPALKSPWGDLTLFADWRGTFYSARQDPSDPDGIVDRTLWRSLVSAGVSFIGPRIQRVYDTPQWSYSPKLKHVIEPFLRYVWRPESSIDPADVVRADTIDVIPAELSDLSYGIRQRLVVKRPAATGPRLGLGTAPEISFEGLDAQQKEAERRAREAAAAPQLDEAIDVDERLNPVVIAEFELSQNYSFVRSLSRRFVTFVDPITGEIALGPTGRPLTGVRGEEPFSPITARLSLKPPDAPSVDIRYVWDPVNDVLNEAAITTSMPFTRGYLHATWFQRVPSDPGAADRSSTAQVRWGVEGRERRLRFENELNYDFSRGELRSQAYALHYASQCCTVRLRYSAWEFFQNRRREVSLTIDLAGIGSVLDRKWRREE